MVGVILTILKMIGIVLLSLLALLLILIGIFLFLPVNYRLKASKNAEGARGYLYVNWLFHLLRVCVEYEQESGMEYSVKMLFFQIFPKQEKHEKITRTKKIKKVPKTEKKDKTEESRNNNHNAEVSENITEVLQKEDIPKKTFQKNKEVPEEVQVVEKKKSLFEMVKEKIRKLKFTFCKICDKMKEICSAYEKFKEFIFSEEIKGSLKFLNEQRKYLVRHLKPSKADVYLHFGTDDPSLTGEILAALSVVYPFYGYKLEAVPDFEQVCFEGNVFIKGKIQCYVMLLTAWRAYKNKYIRKMIGKIKK